jgi:hypothetical protein
VQSGNKKQHSTETLNLLITDHLLDAMDMYNKKLSAVILIDLSYAFDSISHSILLNKLSAIGVSQETVKCVGNCRKLGVIMYCSSRAYYSKYVIS